MASPARKILVTGATGYVGGRLAPRLLADGITVRWTHTAAEDDAPWWAQDERWSEQLEALEMDVLDPEQVSAAVDGVDAVYYLIHGMGGADFEATDHRAAELMSAALDEHGVDRVVYLSGIVPDLDDEDELSAHITSRTDVEQVLGASSATAITLRAAVLIGSGSTSFEIIRQVSDRLPVQTVPTWMDSDVQPIALVDALEALVGALNPELAQRHYDVGGPDVMPYGDLLQQFAEIAGLSRPQVTVPLLPTGLVGTLVGKLTSVPDNVVEALVESLHHDMVLHEDDFVEDLLPQGYSLLPLDVAIRRSLAEPDRSVPPQDRDPMAALPGDPG